MSDFSTIFVGLDQHNESIAVVYVGADRSLEPIYLGPSAGAPLTSTPWSASCNPRARSSSSLRGMRPTESKRW